MKITLFSRFSRGRKEIVTTHEETRTVVEIDATKLSRVFAAPIWLRDLGFLAWFLVGIGLLLVGLVWLFGLMSTITTPGLVGMILATVTGPLVGTLRRKGVPRAAGAAIVLLLIIALGVLIGLLVVAGIVEQGDEIKAAASQASDRIEGWANDVDANGTSSA